jgi:hypothetical protein
MQADKLGMRHAGILPFPTAFVQGSDAFLPGFCPHHDSVTANRPGPPANFRAGTSNPVRGRAKWPCRGPKFRSGKPKTSRLNPNFHQLKSNFDELDTKSRWLNLKSGQLKSKSDCLKLNFGQLNSKSG